MNKLKKYTFLVFVVLICTALSGCLSLRNSIDKSYDAVQRFDSWIEKHLW